MTDAKHANNLPLIAVMIGDPAGIGPEISVMALASGELNALCRPFLIGDIGVIKRAAKVLGTSIAFNSRDSITDLVSQDNVVSVLDPGGLDVSRCPFGISSAEAGRAVLRWMAIGEELGAQGVIDGLVMAPVNSEAIKLTGQISEVDDLIPKGTFMLRMNGSLRVVPLTEHLRLAEAITQVTPSAVLHVVELLNQNLIKWGLPGPRIAVAGINPHAMFAEDREKILPAVEQARRAGLDIHGPIPPDSVFRQTMEGKYDAVVTMYHDQGQIAVKTARFEGACSVYLGLPYVMLNVPHGSAYDIAGTGTAQHESILAAIKTAASLASGTGLFP